LIQYKTEAEIAIMRANGRILARILREAGESIVPGKTTTQDLDDLIARLIQEAGATASFYRYRDFPAHACICVNEVVVHGIPSRDTVLREGDIVGIDAGVFKDGFHADSARTFPVGKISEATQKLLNVTKESLNQGIAKAKVGNRIGDIAAAVQKYAESYGFGVVRALVGHGIGRSLHESPEVPNFGRPKTGPVLREGMNLAIEPMINQGTWKVEELQDGWTIVTGDRLPAAHYEHTVAITKNGPEILTVE